MRYVHGIPSHFPHHLSWVAVLLALMIAVAGKGADAAGKVPVETVAVMAPLFVESGEMGAFESLLDEAKAMGVNAVSVDVWWGIVEQAGDQSFDWSYYDQVFQKIRDRDLKIVAILSFHKCGGGPGDDCNIPLPGWLWNHFSDAGLNVTDLKYESETGALQDDAIVPWATENPAVLAEFSELMEAFEEHFATIAGDFVELNISLGPTGELRYPAYNKADGWNYPQRGHFQAYSELAQVNFRSWALNEFGGLSGVSKRWNIPLARAEDIRPPGGHLPDGSGKRAETFVRDNDHVDTQYGRDFIDWYNQSLVGHGKRLLLAAAATFDGPWAEVPLGMKIPGVHWQMMCTPTPRIAEITAGLVQTSLNLQSVGEARSDAFGYKAIIDMVSNVKAQVDRDVVLHFTALEMDNDANCGLGTSRAEALVFWISHGAEDRGITHKGENALACVGGPEPGSPDNRSWDKIQNTFDHAPYSGFTLLRLTNKGCAPWSHDKGHYRAFIDAYTSARPP